MKIDRSIDSYVCRDIVSICMFHSYIDSQAVRSIELSYYESIKLSIRVFHSSIDLRFVRLMDLSYDKSIELSIRMFHSSIDSRFVRLIELSYLWRIDRAICTRGSILKDLPSRVYRTLEDVSSKLYLEDPSKLCLLGWSLLTYSR